MQPKSFYPVIGTKKIAETVAFYEQHFGFAVTFESDWYASLRHAGAPQSNWPRWITLTPVCPRLGKSRQPGCC